MPQLECTVSPGLWELLRANARRTRQRFVILSTGPSPNYFEAAHHTLFQVSTATALVEGIYQRAVRVGNLREHGDQGLGTLKSLMARW
jgi:acetolactate decarboxylase